jgi:ATP phosphoribosyltransferase regulatory subunit HisZ
MMRIGASTPVVASLLAERIDDLPVRYVRRGQAPSEALFAQPYRGATAVLQRAAQGRREASGCRSGRRGSPVT